MKLSFALLGGLFALASAHQCGTKPNADIKALHASLAANNGTRRRDQYRRPAGEPFQIPTFFHVITCGNQTTPGFCNGTVTVGNLTYPRMQTVVSPKAVEDQLAALNTAYAPAGFSFVLNDTAFVPAPQWRDLEILGDAEKAMKTALRRGDYATLNVYVTPIAPDAEAGSIVGYATFPGRASKAAFARDGVVVDSATLPGVDKPPFNRGMTLVHEVGHWLSLLHTFEAPDDADDEDPLAGCRGPGDYMYDTPAEGTSATGCEIGRDTCTGSIEAENTWSMPGPDPIHNYMDYSYDACLYEFTPMQVERMAEVYVDVRINYVEGTFEGPGPDEELEREAQEKAAQEKAARKKAAQEKAARKKAAQDKFIDRRPLPSK
ncbi:metalloprotease MEP1-like protein [Cordyceps fumosorosea ARSEF 2679]|uniref:Metalloprotease MEP1-like protein n=1 Tax=Cordyceps fumosorosea (strain ARSEF 2679) TaxID=1081104 RepID=A0A162J2R0_CORFA|nr:metalloprotease MEP1-like protein [Cordyceps fumosorosea ARSEF 2679]OAA62952.1 metalloprotease MEP1-like protein [Cordyceps fumosorosea ARSEF 2679]